MAGDEAGEVRGCGEGGVDVVLEAGGAVVDPAEVEFEAVAAAAALEGEVREVVGVAGGGGGVEEVGGGEGV